MIETVVLVVQPQGSGRTESEARINIRDALARRPPAGRFPGRPAAPHGPGATRLVRRNAPAPSRIPSRIVMTLSIAALPDEAQLAIWARLREYDAFTPDNDPRGERNFGVLTTTEYGFSGRSTITPLISNTAATPRTIPPRPSASLLPCLPRSTDGIRHPGQGGGRRELSIRSLRRPCKQRDFPS